MQGDENLLEKPTLRRALHGLLAVLAEARLSLAEADMLLDPADPHGMRAWALGQVNDRYAKKALMRLEFLAGDPRLRKEFEIETIGTENRLAPLLSSPAMRAIVGHQLLDMRDVLDEGMVLLVNAAGSDAASEGAGDLLGKLVMRSVLFAAKRRMTSTVALVIADECPRYVSDDWERALAELRKYRVGIISAHQTFSQFGERSDPVRQAIEKIPATKIAFRLNSMQEAAELAPDLMRLNLEMPVEALIRETVVGHEVRRMRSASIGRNISQSKSFATTNSSSRGVTHNREESEGKSYSRTVSHETSRARTKGRSRGVADGESQSRGTASSESESDSETNGESSADTQGVSSTRGGSRNEQHGTSSGGNFSQSFDVPVNSWRSGEHSYGRAAQFGEASGRNVTAGYDSGRSHMAGSAENWSDSDSASTSRATQNSRSHATTRSRADSETSGFSHVVTATESESETQGESEGVAFASGTTKGHSRGVARSEQSSVGKTAGTSLGQGRSAAHGWSEALAPVLKKRPSAVHSLENVTHMAAEMLCSLPTGVAIVRTVKDGRIEGAVVRVPYRECAPVSDAQYAADLQVLIPHSVGLPMAQARCAIEERENKLIAAASTMKVVGNQNVAEPMLSKDFRVPVRRASKAAKRRPK
jgi:hypothetical protein